jgi:hypothetical protein
MINISERYLFAKRRALALKSSDGMEGEVHKYWFNQTAQQKREARHVLLGEERTLALRSGDVAAGNKVHCSGLVKGNKADLEERSKVFHESLKGTS